MCIDVLGVDFDSLTAQDAVSRACEMISSRKKGYVVTPNPEIVWMARRNEKLKSAIRGAALTLPDGIGIILAARILGRPLREKIAGIEFIEALFAEMAKTERSVYLFGAKPGVAERAGQNLAAAYPGLCIAGATDGYFTDNEAIVDKINSARPDVLLVCLGAPKQELWMAENLARIDVALCAGLGGSLDVFAGEVRRAPAFFRKLELEWLYRLIKQPSRIKRMIKLPLFVFAAIWARIRGR